LTARRGTEEHTGEIGVNDPIRLRERHVGECGILLQTCGRCLNQDVAASPCRDHLVEHRLDLRLVTDVRLQREAARTAGDDLGDDVFGCFSDSRRS
jgi:hypothetical protein